MNAMKKTKSRTFLARAALASLLTGAAFFECVPAHGVAPERPDLETAGAGRGSSGGATGKAGASGGGGSATSGASGGSSGDSSSASNASGAASGGGGSPASSSSGGSSGSSIAGGNSGSSAAGGGSAGGSDAAAGDTSAALWPGCFEPVMAGVTPEMFCSVYAKACGFMGANHYSSMADCMGTFHGLSNDGDACKAGHLCRATMAMSDAMKEMDCATSAKAKCSNK